MATFKTAYRKFMYQPIDLDTADFKVLKERNPELFEAAYEAWRRALAREHRKKSGILPVVRLERSK